MLGTDEHHADFEYIVQKVVPARICFGSTLQRNTNPIGKGLGCYQKRLMNELYPKVSAQIYDHQHITSGLARLQNKIRSKRGVPGLADNALRFNYKIRTHVPSPTRYDPEPLLKTFKQNKVPFNKCMPKKSRKKFTTPGVGAYDPKLAKGEKTRFQFNFGHPTMMQAVEVLCTPAPSDECDRCGAICRYDYWHKDHTSFLCHVCMEEEKALSEDYTLSQLKEFKKMRLCTYMHNHEGANAAELLLPKHKLVKKERLENYLDIYISSF